MNSRYFYLATLLLFFFTSAYSQSFKGKVLDKNTIEPIPFAEVYFVDLNTGTTTDADGYFELHDFNPNTIHIQITFIGYTPIDEIINTSITKEKTFYMEEAHLNLKEVIVSAPSGRLQGENIVSIEQKKITELQYNSPLTLAEAISNISGVDRITTGSGIGKAVIRGLSGVRIVTYAQGIRVENQQWGDEHGLGVGDVGIDHVEVIKGPASLLYGSDALGGVLYFVDEHYTSQESIEGFVKTKFLSNSLSSINNAGLKIHRGKIKFNAFGTYASHADYRIPNYDRVHNTRFAEKNLKGTFGYNTKTWVANLRYSFLQNNFGIVEDSTYSQSTQRDFILPYQTIDNHSVSFENTFYSGESKLNITLGYANNHRKEIETDIDNPDLDLSLNTMTYNAKWYSPSYNNRFDFIIGSQGMVQSNTNLGEEILIPDAKTTDIGGFVIGNWNVQKFQFQGGARADYRLIDSKEMMSEDINFASLKKSFTGLSFSGGVVFKMDKIKYRANISSGFRAPNTSELLSNGVQPGTSRFVIGDSHLVNENAIQIDFSLDYVGDHLSVSINPFYNAINHYIFLSPADSMVNNYPVYKYLQTNAFLYGGEAGLHYHPHNIHWLHFESTLSTVFAQDNNGHPLPFIPQTKINSTVKAEFSGKRLLGLKNVFLQHIYKFKQDRTGFFETPTNAYGLINTGIKMVRSSHRYPIEVEAGIKNLLNVKYIDHLSRFKTFMIPNQGRNFYLGLKVSFQKKWTKETSHS